MRYIIENPPTYCQRYDWQVYIEKLDQYFDANDIVCDKRKVAVLLMATAEEEFQRLYNICSPKEPKDFTYTELTAMMAKQYVEQVSVYRERKRFYAAKRYEREMVAYWYARVKKNAVTCQFGASYERIVLDRFICGMRPGSVFDMLCDQDESLTLERAYDLALTKESNERICF